MKTELLYFSIFSTFYIMHYAESIYSEGLVKKLLLMEHFSLRSKINFLI